MKQTVIVSLTFLAGVIGFAQGPELPATSGDAAAVLDAARDALGGDKRISAIKTVVGSGRTRQLQGDNLVPIEFEINIELPDKYVRTDEIPARESGPNSRGFNGDGLIQSGNAPGPGPRRGGPPPSPTIPVKQDFARLTLGMFATSFSAYPLSFGHAGQAEAPEGKADVLDVKGGGNFSARFFIDSKTHLPLMLSWTTPPNFVPVVAGQKPPATLPPGSVTFETPMPPPDSATPEQKKQFEADALEARKKAMASTRPIENRIYYADYRDVDGLKLPFRIRRAIGATTVEETLFDRYRINAKAVYVQDDIRIRRNLTVTPGVRVETQTHIKGVVAGPRIGTTWAPFTDGKTTSGRAGACSTTGCRRTRTSSQFASTGSGSRK